MNPANPCEKKAANILLACDPWVDRESVVKEVHAFLKNHSGRVGMLRTSQWEEMLRCVKGAGTVAQIILELEKRQNMERAQDAKRRWDERLFVALCK